MSDRFHGAKNDAHAPPQLSDDVLPDGMAFATDGDEGRRRRVLDAIGHVVDRAVAGAPRA